MSQKPTSFHCVSFCGFKQELGFIALVARCDNFVAVLYYYTAISDLEFKKIIEITEMISF